MNFEQPKPSVSKYKRSWLQVIKDFKQRDDFGFKKYNTHLQPFNGRDTAVDVYEEALDFIVYLRTLIEERMFWNEETEKKAKRVINEAKNIAKHQKDINGAMYVTIGQLEELMKVAFYKK